MYVTTADGKIEYVACSPFEVQQELAKFYADMELLLKTEIGLQQVFYYAALLHLVFVKIHPFDDGNVRMARLLEKWFLAEKLGEKAWLIQSEKNYYRQHQVYYQNIRLLGLEYEQLNYEKALPFLLMLPKALINEGR
jgi:Fic family protein